MLNSQELTNFITDRLNEIGSAWHDPFSFKLVAEVGEDSGGADIRGILRTDAPPEYVPVPGKYTEGKYSFTVDLLVPAVRTNYQVLQVEQIVSELVKENQNVIYQFSDGQGIVTFSAGKTGTYQVAYGTGNTVPVTFTVRVTYTENAVTSANKHWLLNGTEIPFLSESVALEREGMTRKIYDQSYTRLLLTGQTKYYTFEVPYESEFFGQFQKEILDSSIHQSAPLGRYTLKYYDGVSFTESAPYTATVKVYRSAKSSSTRPNGAVYELTFTDYAVPAQTYQLGLLDFPFDSQGDDTRFFASVEEQIAYFENKVNNGSAPFKPIEAPCLDSLFITRQVYQGVPYVLGNQFDYAGKNYAVIKVVSPSAKTYYFYYFITKSTIGAEGQMLLDLQLDTVQTYFFNPEISFSDCLIERAHLNRFEKTPAGTVQFIHSPDSKIFNAEEGLNFPKRLVSRTKLNLSFTGNTTVDTWLNENVAYWVYVFIDPMEATMDEKGKVVLSTYKTFKILENPNPNPDGEIPGSYGRNKMPFELNGATSVFCYPIYKNALYPVKDPVQNVIQINARPDDNSYMVTIIPNSSGRNDFELNNSNTSYYYTIKLSIIPPFSSAENMSVVGNNLVIDAKINRSLVTYEYGFAYNEKQYIIACSPGYGTEVGHTYSGLFFGSNQTKKELETSQYPLLENKAFLSSDIIKQQPPNLDYNPKLNSQNFKELIITAASGDTFTYDIQKIGGTPACFLYSEPIQPEITKYYMRLKPVGGLYLEGTESNYTGLVGSTDNGLAFTNDQYAAFIANNKNFYMQSNMKIATSAAKSTVGIIGQAASGNVAGAAGSAISTGVDVVTGLMDRSMTIDNMKNAPDQMKNANGNVIFNMFATDLGLYVEKYSALEGDLKTANDFMNLYGFSFNGIANVRDYANIRKYHNYVKAQLQGIAGNISNAARMDLRQRFANGIRFWNQDNISYQYENYELWLED